MVKYVKLAHALFGKFVAKRRGKTLVGAAGGRFTILVGINLQAELVERNFRAWV
ncbi:hypothetical protein TRAPUB_589 [Trametes pubescens]|uniref:Uncharacterized protein n=1 Tax=Trametes pubescens TaxID=154538 RepID=A0A1M2VLP7_TRAPU|nr:hypothetical protein TRAPUB_589 [Trametes pubescens]